jgi:hypothetical protein
MDATPIHAVLILELFTVKKKVLGMIFQMCNSERRKGSLALLSHRYM